MNRYAPRDLVFSMLKTLTLLVFLEIITSAVFPALGLVSFKPEFNILIVLYLAFKLDDPTLPILILITQIIHGGFTIEGWAIGTFAGVLVSLSVRYVKDMLDFSTGITTMIVIQVSQFIWYLFTTTFISIKISSFENFIHLMWQSFPESIFISISSPIFFALLDRFWISRQSSQRI